MKVPVSWLRDYVDVDLTPDELAELVTNAGMEVEKVHRVGIEGADFEWHPELCVLAHLHKVEQHPDADRLVLATVDYGPGADGGESRTKQVVTGAPNLFEHIGDGDLAARQIYSPMVLEGAMYLDAYKDMKPTKLKGKKLRGVYNDAMLCSAVELGLGEDHDGIVLIEQSEHPSELTAGTPLRDVLGDAVLDIDIIPNIARCASMVGIAREVAALTGKELRLPPYEVHSEGPSVEGRVQITTDDPELNPRFCALLVEGVEQKPAPFWMQHRLTLAGQRPINVVVDISNYVMLEMGQPNHTFDWDFLERRAENYGAPVHIHTRLPQSGETLTTLDGTEHELPESTILVTDPEGSLSLGGIMGGRDSEIQDDTTNVLVEAAAWNFINIRQSARKLALHTEAGFRFSRGVHPSQAILGARRAAELLRLHAGGTVARGEIDAYHLEPEAPVTDLDPAYVRRLSGLDLGAERMAELLRRLEFTVEEIPAPEIEGESKSRSVHRIEGEPHLRVTAPDHRLDIEGKHDLLEEVCRMHGYANIPSTVLDDSLPPQRSNAAYELEEHIKDRLAASGLQEVITYRLTTPEAEALLLGEDESRTYATLTNPSTQERSSLRHSVLASVLEIAAANARFRDRLAMFELGHQYLPASGEKLPNEIGELALVLSGTTNQHHSNWANETRSYDFFDLKGVVERLAGDLHLDVAYEPAEDDRFRPGRTARVSTANGKALGLFGELHPVVVERYGFGGGDDRPVLVASFDLAALVGAAPERVTVDPVPVVPATREDLALVVDAGTPSAAVEGALMAGGKPLLKSVQLFDVYEGEHLPEGKKSLAYHLTFQSNKTLNDKAVAKIRKKILGQAEREVGAALRE
ncbi:MAG: phenylalanine--tRNA ligase subunit beta [Acidobacteriota bacterium]